MKLRLKSWVKFVLFLILISSFFILFSRYIGTNGLKIKEYSIVDSKLPNNFYGLKIVQISDIHYKVTTDKKELEKIVNEINLLKPDIVILNGDLFNKNINYSKDDYTDLTEMLNNINCNIGKYAIKGDNDKSTSNWENIMNNSNFINLNDNYEFIYSQGLDPILLIGIDSENNIKKNINNIYNEINEKYDYSILILHKPDNITKIDYSKFNLVLAGHSLNGQIKLPWLGGIIKPNGAKIYYEEYYELDSTKLFISGGIGTNKYKFRFNNTPSINFFRLKNK